MALPFVPSDAGLLALQAAVVAAPRQAPKLPLFERLRGPAWAIIPVASIVVVVLAVRFLSDTATALTWLAVVAVPPLAAIALAWAVHSRAPVSRQRVAVSVRSPPRCSRSRGSGTRRSPAAQRRRSCRRSAA